MMRSRYTVTGELHGKCQAWQLSARSAREVQELIGDAVDWAEIAPRSTKPRFRFAEDDTPTPVEGLTNVWCMTGYVDDHLVIMNIVLMDEAAAFHTIDLRFCGGTYLKQVAAESISFLVDHLDETIDWDAIAPSPKERAFEVTEAAAMTSDSAASVRRLVGRIDEDRATVFVVATANGVNGARDDV